MLNFRTYNQWDTEWGSEVMTPGTRTLASDGCLVTTLADGVPNFTYNFTPGQLCKKCATGGAFMKSSDLSWAGFESCFPQLKVAGREDTTANKFHDANPVEQATAIERLTRMVRYGQVVALNVDHIKNDGVADHWILLADDKWNVHDPDGGVAIPFSQRYGDPMTGVKGYAIITGTPMAFVDGATKEECDRGVAIGQAVILIREYPNDPVVRALFDGLTR